MDEIQLKDSLKQMLLILNFDSDSPVHHFNPFGAAVGILFKRGGRVRFTEGQRSSRQIHMYTRVPRAAGC